MAPKKTSATAKRLATLTKQTSRQKVEMLEQLKKTPIVQTACAKTGVGHSTYYAWRRDDKGFEKASDEAKHQGKLFINDMAESQLIRKIQDGSSMTAIIYWLKNNHPDYTDTVRYIHRYEVADAEIDEKEVRKIAKALYNLGLAEIIRMNKPSEDDEPRGRENPVRKKTLGELVEEEEETN